MGHWRQDPPPLFQMAGHAGPVPPLSNSATDRLQWPNYPKQAKPPIFQFLERGHNGPVAPPTSKTNREPKSTESNQQKSPSGLVLSYTSNPWEGMWHPLWWLSDAIDLSPSKNQHKARSYFSHKYYTVHTIKLVCRAIKTRDILSIWRQSPISTIQAGLQKQQNTWYMLTRWQSIIVGVHKTIVIAEIYSCHWLTNS